MYTYRVNIYLKLKNTRRTQTIWRENAVGNSDSVVVVSIFCNDFRKQ